MAFVIGTHEHNNILIDTSLFVRTIQHQQYSSTVHLLITAFCQETIIIIDKHFLIEMLSGKIIDIIIIGHLCSVFTVFISLCFFTNVAHQLRSHIMNASSRQFTAICCFVQASVFYFAFDVLSVSRNG